MVKFILHTLYTSNNTHTKKSLVCDNYEISKDTLFALEYLCNDKSLKYKFILEKYDYINNVYNYMRNYVRHGNECFFKGLKNRKEIYYTKLSVGDYRIKILNTNDIFGLSIY